MSVDAHARLHAIRERIEVDGSVKVADLARTLGVSEMTIRRDLDALDDQGQVRRLRGGATAVGPRQVADRFDRQARAKQRIAAKLAELVDDGGAVGFDASTTLQRLAARLGTSREATAEPARDLTVLTNGEATFAELVDRPGITPVLTGGERSTATGSLVGPLAVRAAGALALRRLFVSAAAIDPRLGSTEATLAEAEVKVAMASAAAELVVAVDHTKLGHHGSARAFALGEIAVLVTDLDPGDRRLEPYRTPTMEIR